MSNTFQSLYDFVNSVKPYHSKIIEVQVEYIIEDYIDVTIIDSVEFDIHTEHGFINLTPGSCGGFGVLGFGNFGFGTSNSCKTENESVTEIGETLQIQVITDLSVTAWSDGIYGWGEGGWNTQLFNLLFPLTAVNTGTQEFSFGSLTGDEETYFPVGAKFIIKNSTGNNGIYTVAVAALWNSVDTITLTSVEVIPDGTVDGEISFSDGSISDIVNVRLPVHVYDAGSPPISTVNFIDGIEIFSGMRGLFATTGNIYIASGTTSAWTWTEDTELESCGDEVYIKFGTHSRKTFSYDGANWIHVSTRSIARFLVGSVNPRKSVLVAVNDVSVPTQSVVNLDGEDVFSGMRVLFYNPTFSGSIGPNIYIARYSPILSGFQWIPEDISQINDLVYAYGGSNINNYFIFDGVNWNIAATEINTVTYTDIQC